MMKLALLLLAFLSCTAQDSSAHLRALAKPETKVFVCSCTGSDAAMTCKQKKVATSTADAMVAAGNGTSVEGKCENVKFELCKCNGSMGNCHTIKVAAQAVPAQVKKVTTTLGACVTSVSTNTTDTNTTDTNTTDTSNTTDTNVTRW